MTMQFLRIVLLHPTDAMIVFFQKNRLHVATMVGIYETRVETSDNGLKRGTGQTPRKFVNANQPGRNNNLNAGPKSDKIAKDTINAPKSRK